MNYFIYNGKQSISDMELYFEYLPILPVTSFNEVDDSQIVCSVGVKNKNDIILNIRKWLSNTEGLLSFSFDARKWNVTNILVRETRRNKTFITLDITFYVNKYCYLNNNSLEINNNFEDITILNQGNFSTLPLITIEGEGNINISINNNSICTIENVNKTITIDSEIEECWTGDSLNIVSVKNSDFYGEFPYFDIGINKLSIDSTTNAITKVIIDGRWRI